MEIKQLRCLIASAEEQHVGRAADRLHVTQSALSQQLRRLEEEVGVSLFERHRRGMRLTAEGEVLLKHSRVILQRLRDAQNDVDAMAGLIHGSVRCATIQSINFQLLPEAVGRLHSRSPRTHMEIAEMSGGQVEDAVAEGRVDFGIGFLPTLRNDLDVEVLFSEQLMLVVGRDHDLADPEPLDFRQLNDVPMAMLTERFFSRRLFDNAAQSAGMKPRVAVETNTTTSLLLLARHSELAVVVPGLAVPAWLADEVAVRPLRNPTPRRSIGLLWPKGTPHSPLSLELCDCLRGCIRDAPFADLDKDPRLQG